MFSEKKFSVYGRINGIDINPNGFAFIQFAHLEDALRAVNGENGTLLKQRKLGKLINLNRQIKQHSNHLLFIFNFVAK